MSTSHNKVLALILKYSIKDSKDLVVEFSTYILRHLRRDSDMKHMKWQSSHLLSPNILILHSHTAATFSLSK